MDRESVAATIFVHSGKGKKRDRDSKVVHSLKDKKKSTKKCERKVDSAVQGELLSQQKLYEAEVEARNWEKRNSDIAFHEFYPSDFSYIKLKETKLVCCRIRIEK